MLCEETGAVPGAVSEGLLGVGAAGALGADAEGALGADTEGALGAAALGAARIGLMDLRTGASNWPLSRSF